MKIAQKYETQMKRFLMKKIKTVHVVKHRLYKSNASDFLNHHSLYGIH